MDRDANLNMPQVTIEHIVQSVDGLLALLSQVVCDGTKFRGFSSELSNNALSTVTEKLTLAQSYVNTIRNGQLPACSLPPEILNIIFSMTTPTLSDFDPPVPPLTYTGQFESDVWWSKHWHPVRLTGVCRYWKATTLLFPSIWTTINLGAERLYPNANADLAQLCLRRSYGSSIDVYIWTWLSEDVMPWVTETLASQSMRFRGLHLYNFDFDLSFLQHFAECPTPQLQSLTIAPQSGIIYILPPIFAGHTPLLRHLTLANFTSWRGNDFTNLTSLCLRNCAQTLTYREFIDFLASSPELEIMEISEAGPIIGSYDIPGAYQVALPHLRFVGMELIPSMHITRILSHLQPSTTLSLRIQHLAADALRPGSILSVTSRLDAMKNVSKLRLDTEWATSHKRLRLTGAGKSSFDLPWSADVHEMASNQYMAAAIGLLTACSIAELWIGEDDVIVREELWQRLLFALPSLTKLVLGPWTFFSPGLLSALYSPDESVGLALPCPVLRELVIFGQLEEPGFLESAYSLLVQRKLRGFPITRVVLLRRPFPAVPLKDRRDYAETFREVVQDVRFEIVSSFPEMDSY